MREALLKKKYVIEPKGKCNEGDTFRKGGVGQYLWKVIRINHRDNHDSLLVEYIVANDVSRVRFPVRA